MRRSELTQAKVRKLFDYDPITGILFRKKVNYTVKEGPVNHVNTSGYILVVVCGHSYFAHRIIWLYVHGHFPNGFIDHINHCKHDNRLENLRDVSVSKNNKNMSLNRKNKTFVRGVSWLRNDFRWKACISHNSKNIHLGQFIDYYEAVAYRLAAEQCIDWESYQPKSSALEQLCKYLNNK